MGLVHRKPKSTSMPKLRVHLLPEGVTTDDMAGSTCVVIDVLRATTTMVYALAAGALGVIPCLTIEEARQRAAALPAGQSVLGGERGGLPIPGFDLGNSPSEYTPQVVVGKTLVLTTTNGTRAFGRCKHAREVLIGAFANLSAVVDLLAAGSLIDVICAGTDGRVTREDVLLAGAIVTRLTADDSWELNDEAAIARDTWAKIAAHATAKKLARRLVEALRASHGGRNLVAIGMEHDIELAAEVDRFAIVPRFDPAVEPIEIRATATGHVP
jgi:2-phosphosulfolactate phosphatase